MIYGRLQLRFSLPQAPVSDLGPQMTVGQGSQEHGAQRWEIWPDAEERHQAPWAGCAAASVLLVASFLEARGGAGRRGNPRTCSRVPSFPVVGCGPTWYARGASPQSCCASHHRTLLQHRWGWVQFPHIAGGIQGSRLLSGLRLPDESGFVGLFSPSSFLGGGFPGGRRSLKLGHHLTNMC